MARVSNRSFQPLLSALLVLPPASGGHADHGDGSAPLHFSHPLVTESPSPDTKVRVDWEFLDLEDGTFQTARLGAEYAFHPSFSIELAVPWSLADPDGASSESGLDTIEVAFKFANFAFADHGLLLSYGLELGLPTGDDDKGIGSDHELELEPFLAFGYRREALEVVGFGAFGIPTNQADGDEVETEFAFDLSALYHFGRVEGLLELDGETVLSGEERGETQVNLSPGVKVALLEDRRLKVGASVGIPLNDHEEFDTRFLLSVFYHF